MVWAAGAGTKADPSAGGEQQGYHGRMTSLTLFLCVQLLVTVRTGKLHHFPFSERNFRCKIVTLINRTKVDNTPALPGLNIEPDGWFAVNQFFVVHQRFAAKRTFNG